MSVFLAHAWILRCRIIKNVHVEELRGLRIENGVDRHPIQFEGLSAGVEMGVFYISTSIGDPRMPTFAATVSVGRREDDEFNKIFPPRDSLLQ